MLSLLFAVALLFLRLLDRVEVAVLEAESREDWKELPKQLSGI